MADIVLVGTSHIDHKGPERLEKVLGHYRPSVVCLEQTPAGATSSWRGHLDIVQKLRDTPWEKFFSPEQIERVKLELMSSNYEQWVPKEYKGRFPDTILYCIDKEFSPEFHASVDYSQQAWLRNELAKGRELKDILTPVDCEIMDFVKAGSISVHQEHIDKGYDICDVSEIVSIYGQSFFEAVVLERDRLFAERIRVAHQKHPGKTILATLGNNHVFGDYAPNTFALLSDLNPTRIKLKDADSL